MITAGISATITAVDNMASREDLPEKVQQELDTLESYMQRKT